MQQQILHLFFYGAIAFVPNNTRPTTEMTAYLMKVGSPCTHTPLLTFKMEGESVCGVDPLDRCNDPITSKKTCCGTKRLGGDTLCICKLVDVDLKINPSPHQTPRNLRPAPGGEIPSEGQENDLSWLVRIANFDGTASRAKDWPALIREVPVPVTARVQFGWDDADACHIDQNLKASIYRVNSFRFVPLEALQTAISTDIGYRQALAEYVEFTSSLDLQPVEISLTEISAAPKKPVKIALGCRGVCPDVFISNSLSGEDCEEEDVGLHFLHYYHLSRKRGSDLFPVRTSTSTQLTSQYSCGPRSGPLRVNHPLAQLRIDLGVELDERLNKKEVRREDLQDLEGVVQVFGRDSSELSMLLSDLLKKLRFKLHSEVVTLLEEWLKGIQSRIICPVAMFDP